MVRYFLYIAAIIVNVACTSNVVDIDAKDNVSFGTFEASFPLSEQQNEQIKIRASKASGNYAQTTPSGKLVIINGSQINGPAEVQGTTDLAYYSVSYGKDILFKDFFYDENNSPRDLYGIWGIGIAQTDLDFTLLHGGNRYRVSDKTTQLFGQVGLRYPITKSFSGSVTLGLGIGKNFNSISEYDLLFNYQLARKMGIIGGFRRVEYNYFVKNESDINVTFTGPFVGVNFTL